MNCVQFQCNNKKTVKKGQLVCLVYTIKQLCCISSVILRKFQSRVRPENLNPDFPIGRTPSVVFVNQHDSIYIYYRVA